MLRHRLDGVPAREAANVDLKLVNGVDEYVWIGWLWRAGLHSALGSGILAHDVVQQDMRGEACGGT